MAPPAARPSGAGKLGSHPTPSLPSLRPSTSNTQANSDDEDPLTALPTAPSNVSTTNAGLTPSSSQTHLAGQSAPESSEKPSKDYVKKPKARRKYPNKPLKHKSTQSFVEIKEDEPKKEYPTFLEVLWTWKFELLAAVFAIGLLACQIVLLAHYDKKFLFLHWSHTWSINSVFAFLATLLEAAVMFYVGASIGQLRWHWFRKRHRKLDWLEIMTAAQRPAGAMRLILRAKFYRQFAVVGAFLVILLLGVNTFTQQVITEVVALYPATFPLAKVPISTNYTWYDGDTTRNVGTQQPLPNMVAAIQNGFYSFSTNQLLGTAQTWTACEGNECDFGKYQSLAVCSACADVSSTVVNPCPSGNCTDTDYYTMSNGVDLSLLATTGLVNLTSDTNYTSNSALSPGPLIVNFHALMSHGAGNGSGAFATECAAWWCVKTYKGILVNGTLQEDVIDHYTDRSPQSRTQYLQPNEVTLRPPQCWINNTASPGNTSYCTYHAGAFTQAAIQNFLAAPDPSLPFPPFLSGSAIWIGNGDNPVFNYTSLLAGGLASASTGRAIMYEVQSGFAQMAEQMTVTMRGQRPVDNIGDYSYGKTSYLKQRFHVRWGWLAFPISIVAISLVFLGVTMFQTRRDESWKSSILPILFHSFGGMAREEFVKLDTVKAMKKESRERRVRLGSEHGHSAFEAGAVVQPHSRMFQRSLSAGAILGSGMEILNQAQNGG